LYEDALEYCNVALETDKDEEEVKYIKAKILSYLFKFKESIKLFKENDHTKDIEWVEKLEAQRKGLYARVIKNAQKYNDENRILNYVNGVQIKMTEDRGRGVFATRFLKKGTLIAVETAAVEALDYKTSDAAKTTLVEKCADVAKLKGVEALRMSYLYDGTPNSKIPPLDIFVQNNYQQYSIPDISKEKLAKIVKYNCFYDDEAEKPENALFCFQSFINHGVD